MRASAFIRKTADKGCNAKARVYFRVRDTGCDIKAASELAIHSTVPCRKSFPLYQKNTI